MAASLAITPTNPTTHDPIVISGFGFLPDSKVTLTFQEGTNEVDATDIKTDAAGSFSTTDAADPAIATLTSDGTNVSVDDTVTIGAVTYTFKAAPTTVANEVKIGASAAATLANLKAAINHTGTPGTDYGSGTVVHPTVYADTITSTTLLLIAKSGGTGGNSLASTEASTHLSFGGGTFSGGAAATGYREVVINPGMAGTYHFTATDGSSTASLSVLVFAA
jgi:hypothetical protein